MVQAVLQSRTEIFSQFGPWKSPSVPLSPARQPDDTDDTHHTRRGELRNLEARPRAHSRREKWKSQLHT